MWTGMLYKCPPHPIKTLADLSLPVLQWDGIPQTHHLGKGRVPSMGWLGASNIARQSLQSSKAGPCA